MKKLIFSVVLLSTLFSSQNLFAQNHRGFEKALVQMEMNRYKSNLRRITTGTSATTIIDVKYYRLDVTITTTPQYLKGSVLMNAVSNQNNLSTISIDLMNQLHVDSVKVGSTTVSAVQSPSYFTVTLDRVYNQGELISVQIFYQGIPGSSGFGSFEYSTHSSVPWVWSLSEPYGAKDWWPCNDDPADKADSVDMFVTCDSTYKVGSNGKLISVNNNGNGTHTVHWHESYPISTYLVSVAITNYAEFSNWFKYTPTDSMQVLNYVLPEHLASAQSQLPKVVDELNIYSNLFGLYPFITEKYGHSEFGWGGGMEHETMTSLGGFNDWLTAHELAHQWFGDMITTRTWPNIWLNEGFATYCEHLYEEAEYGNASYWSGINSNMSDAKNATQSVYVLDTSNVGLVFDWNSVYAKGSVVLHMLRHVLGDSTFFHAMYNYAHDPRYRFGNATTADFQGVCETTSGKSLSYFFNEWVYGQSFPQYSTGWTVDSTGSGYLITIAVNQSTQTSNPSYFTMPIDFDFSASGWDTTITLFNNAQTQLFTVIVPHKPTSVQLDPSGWILKNNTPIIAFNPVPAGINFGSVYLFDSVSDTIVVNNVNPMPLKISSAVSDNSMFMVTPDSATILASSNQKFIVTFHSTTVGAQSAHLYFYHNASGSPGTINISAIASHRTFSYVSGWNMVSVPVIVSDNRSATVFPSAQMPAFFYSDIGKYGTSDTLQEGVGYWLKYDSAQQTIIDGIAIDVDSIAVHSGWNMIGSISQPIATMDIESNPPGMTTSKFFGYNRKYFISDTLMPARGYWVKSNESGQIILSSSHFSGNANRIRIMPDADLPPQSPSENPGTSIHQFPKEFALEQNYPNPFNPSTTFTYALPKSAFVRLRIFNFLGQEIAQPVNEEQDAGYKSVEWTPSHIASGVYLYRIDAIPADHPEEIFSSMRKMVLLK